MKEKARLDWALSLAQRLKDLRKSLSMTTVQVANALGLSEAGYRNWECATAVPPPHRLLALADTLDTTVNFILCGAHSKGSEFFNAKLEWESKGCTVKEKDDKTIALTLLFTVTVDDVGGVALRGSKTTKPVVHAQKELNFKDRAQFLAFSRRLFEKTKNYLLAEALNDDAL